MNVVALHTLLLVAAAAAATASAESSRMGKLFLRDSSESSRREVHCSGDVSNDMMRCVQGITYMEHPTTGLELDTVDTDQALDALCNKSHQAKDCTLDVHLACGRGDMLSELSARTVMGVVNYICSPANRVVIIGEASCWKDKQLELEIDKCSQEMYGNPCSSMFGMRNCIKRKVEAFCTARAANFIDAMVYYSMHTIANEALGCEMTLRVPRSVWTMLPRSRK